MPTPKKSGSFALLLFVFVLGAASMGGGIAAMNETDKPGFCGSCHAMSEAVWTHSLSPHASLACNDCHTPHNLAAKLPFKAESGLHDLYLNSTSKVPSVFHAKSDTKSVVQANCLRCHATTNMTVDMDAKEYCVSCHRSVPHMNKMSIERRKAADV